MFKDRNRVATFAAVFLAGGVMFTLTVLIGLYVQDIMGYSALRAGVGFIPFVIALGIGLGLSSALVSKFPPRVLVIAGGVLVLAAMIYGSTLDANIPYFPNLVIPITVGGFGIGMIVVPLTVSAIAGVGFDQIGPVSAIALMLQNLGGPVVLAVIQAVITSRTLYLGGTNGPVKDMNDGAVACPGSGLYLRPAVGGRGRGDRRRRRAVHRLHRRAGGACAGSQGRDRPGRALARHLARESFRSRFRRDQSRCGAFRPRRNPRSVGWQAMSAVGGSSGSDRATTPLSSSVLGLAIIAITGMQLMSTLDGTIVIVALPRMQADLGLSDAGKSWVITAYVLAFGGLLLLGGRIGDAIGHKRAFLSGVGVFTIASLVCGLATDGVTLIVARAVQGTGAAVAAPTGLALIATTYAVGQARNRAHGGVGGDAGHRLGAGPGARRRA